MKWYRWDTSGDLEHPDHDDYFTTDSGTDPVEISVFCLSQGKRVDAKYPDRRGDIRFRLGEDHPGLTPCSFIGNASSILPCTKDLADCILAHNAGETEIVPFLLINHRGRVHSREYVFVNPIGTFDAINMSESTIKRFDDGQIMRIRHLVLDSKKLQDAPDLFRLKEDVAKYLCSEKLANAIRERKFTNVRLDEVDVQ